MAQWQHNPRFGEKSQNVFLYREFFSEMSVATEREELLALGDESMIPVPPLNIDDEENLEQSAADQSIPTTLATATEAALGS